VAPLDHDATDVAVDGSFSDAKLGGVKQAEAAISYLAQVVTHNLRDLRED
jgi:hypothetical protein